MFNNQNLIQNMV